VNTNSSLDGYQIVKHNFQLWEENGVFTLFIPEYGVFTKNEDLSEGYKELTSEKEKYFQKLSEAGISPERLHDLSLSANSNLFKKADARLKEFGQLVLKSIIVIALILGIGSVSLVVAGNVLGKNMGRVLGKIERYHPLEKFVSYVETLPEEKINMYRAQAHRLGVKLKPLIIEIQSSLKSKRDSDSVNQKRDFP
jgi:hypothetical protein